MRTKLHIKLSFAVEHLMGEGNEAKRSLYRITTSILTPLNTKLYIVGRSQSSALRNGNERLSDDCLQPGVQNSLRHKWKKKV